VRNYGDRGQQVPHVQAQIPVMKSINQMLKNGEGHTQGHGLRP